MTISDARILGAILNARPFLVGVLVLELLQPPHLGRQQPVILLLPIEIRRLADPSLAADLGDRHAVVACFRMNAFWASENFEAFIVFRSSQPRGFGSAGL